MRLEVQVESSVPNRHNFGHGTPSSADYPYVVNARVNPPVQFMGFPLHYAHIISTRPYPPGKTVFDLTPVKSNYFKDASPVRENKVAGNFQAAVTRGAEESRPSVPVGVIVSVTGISVPASGTGSLVEGEIFYIEKENLVPPQIRSAFKEGKPLTVETNAPPSLFTNGGTYRFPRLDNIAVVGEAIKAGDPRALEYIEGTPQYNARIFNTLRP